MIEAVRRKREEYWSVGDVASLAESVRLGREALVQLSGAGALQGSAANELAASLGTLYQATREPGLLDEHLALLDRALELLPPGDPNLAPVHTNIAAGRLQRFFTLGDPDDLTAAVAAARRGIEASQPDDPNTAGRHSNLVGALRTLHDVTGDPKDLDESIAAGRAALAAITPATHSQPLILASLAGSLQYRGLQTSSHADLEESIAIARRAMAAATPASPQRRDAGNILAGSLRASSELTGDVSRLSEAIALHRENADLVPSQQAEYASHMAQLAATLLVRYQRQQDSADLDAAEDAAQRALDSGHARATPGAWSLRSTCWRYRVDHLVAEGNQAGARHAADEAVAAAARSLTGATAREYPDHFILRCNALAARHQLTGMEAHRAEAVAAYREAIDGLGADSASGRLATLNLGLVHLRRGQSAPASRADIAEATKLFQQIVAAAEPGEPLWVNATLGRIRAQAQLFEVAPLGVDAEGLAQLHRQVTEAPAVPAKRRAAAGVLAGTVLMQTGHAMAASCILTDAVQQLPAVAWRGARRHTRESELSDLSELGCDAAASHLAAGEGDPGSAARAAEAVEQGRAVLWADMLQLRRGDAGLWQSQPELAARLQDLAAALDIPEEAADSGIASSRTADQRMALAVEWDEIVARVRADAAPGFLRPAPLAELLPAEAHGPVVIVNVSRHRCDALIVTSAGVRTVPLPSLSLAAVARQTARYLDAYTRLTGTGAIQAPGGTEQEDPDQALSGVLEWLWDAVAEPVLGELGIGGTPAPGQPWPRLWWCPTGLLSLLPLHAAGYHADESAGDAAPRTVLDRAVSSYTPTLGALANASRGDASGVTDTDGGRLLFVGLPETPGPGAASLPFARYDRDVVAGKLGARCHVLFAENATVKAVRAGLPSCRWAHFSCHGQQNLTAPSMGGLRLWDGTLSVADLSAQGLKGEFAFLGACQTATGGTALPNEAISLAAALHYAGYRHVIATLWSVYDQAAAEVTQMVYADLADTGQLAPPRSARALHSAVRHVRESRRAKPSWWIPFIHIGP